MFWILAILIVAVGAGVWWCETFVRRGVGYLREYTIRDQQTGELVTRKYRIKFNHQWPSKTPWSEDAVTYKPILSSIPVIMVRRSWCTGQLLAHECGHVEQWYKHGKKMYVDYLVEMISKRSYKNSDYEKNARIFKDFVLSLWPEQFPGLQLSGDELIIRNDLGSK